MLNEKSARTRTLVNNVLGSSFYKGINIVFNLLIVRYSISLIGIEDYGVWLAFYSFLTWFSTLESGISNSFRNQLTKYFTDDQTVKIKELISKGYKALIIAYLTAISALILISFIFPISALFTSSPEQANSFDFMFRVCVIIFLSQFIFLFINSVLLATHQVKTTYKIVAFQNGILLLGLLLANYLGIIPSLLLYAIWFSLIPLLTWFFVNIKLYAKGLNKYKPSLKGILFEKSSPFKNMNKDYFIIQLCTLVLFSSDNLIIMSNLKGTDVSIYNLSFKYFNVIVVLFNLVLVPYWSSFTEAYYKKDKGWIKSSINKLMLLWLGIFLLSLVMIFLSDWAYDLWIGSEIHIPTRLSIFMAISILLTCWNNIFTFFLRGVSIVRFARNLLLFSALINIPLSFWLLYQYEATGVIIATCISLVPMAILLPIKYKSVLRKIN